MTADALVPLLALTTMAAAFHRTRLLIRRSTSGLPGISTCSSAGIELMYGVLAVNGNRTPFSVA